MLRKTSPNNRKSGIKSKSSGYLLFSGVLQAARRPLGWIFMGHNAVVAGIFIGHIT